MLRPYRKHNRSITIRGDVYPSTLLTLNNSTYNLAIEEVRVALIYRMQGRFVSNNRQTDALFSRSILDISRFGAWLLLTWYCGTP